MSAANQPSGGQGTGPNPPKMTSKAGFGPYLRFLTAPLSQLAEVAHIPEFDVETFVQRSKHTRQTEGPRRINIPPPLDTFMLYRKCYAERARGFCHIYIGNYAGILSVCALSWRMESAAVKARFSALGQIEKRGHLDAFHDFKYPSSTRKQQPAAAAAAAAPAAQGPRRYVPIAPKPAPAVAAAGGASAPSYPTNMDTPIPPTLLTSPVDLEALTRRQEGYLQSLQPQAQAQQPPVGDDDFILTEEEIAILEDLFIDYNPPLSPLAGDELREFLDEIEAFTKQNADN